MSKRATRDLITRRSGSPYFYVRLQYNDRHRHAVQAVLGDMFDKETGKKLRLPNDRFVNLDTTDYAEARVRAQPHLTQHFDILALTEAFFSKRPDGAIEKSHLYAPGLKQTLPDGSRIDADTTTYRFYPRGMTQPIEQPNPVTQFQFVPILDDDYVDAAGQTPTPGRAVHR